VSLHNFLQISNMSIAIPPKLLCTPHLFCRDDVNLMEAFRSLDLKTSQIRMLNYCQLFLQVKTLAEICPADGSRRLPTAWQGRSLPSLSTLLWPRQGRPNSWAVWKQLLATLFLADTTTTYCTLSLLHLKKRLGRWKPHHSEHRTWPAYQTIQHIFIQQGGRYEAYRDTMEGRLPSRSFDATPHAAHSLHGQLTGPHRPTSTPKDAIASIVLLQWASSNSQAWTNTPTFLQHSLHTLPSLSLGNQRTSRTTKLHNIRQTFESI
jgi:hypothetical protein